MRDAILVALFAVALPATLWKPWIGALLWAIVSYFNPQSHSWGFASTIPFAMLVACVTIVSMVFHFKELRFPRGVLTLLMILLLLWTIVTSMAALRPDLAWPYFDRFLKILVMTVATAAVITDRRTLNLFVWTVVLSIGFYGIKGGLFTIATGGNYRVWGPEGSMLGGNNEVALALIMTLPLWIYLRGTVERVWAKRATLAAMLLCCVAVIGTQSRGALVGLVGMGGVFWLRSRGKVASGIAIAVLGVGLLMFMPQSWHDRMSTIGEYENDESAQQRLNSWQFAINVAAASPVTGGGFRVFADREAYALYGPNPDWVFDAHSIWFQVLGEHGYVGLALFCALALASLVVASRFRNHRVVASTDDWMGDLGSMTYLGLVGYFVTGTFLSLAYFDLYYSLIAILIVLSRLKATAGQQSPPAGRTATGPDAVRARR